MYGHDVGPRAEVSVTDESVELSPGLDQALVDLLELLALLGGVPVALRTQGALLLLVGRVKLGYAEATSS